MSGFELHGDLGLLQAKEGVIMVCDKEETSL